MTSYNIDEVNVITKEAVKLDRASLHTSLVAAVEELPTKVIEVTSDEEGVVVLSKKAVLTIINSIFKE